MDENLVRGTAENLAPNILDQRRTAALQAGQNVAARRLEVQRALSALQDHLGDGMRKRMGIAAEHVYVANEAFQLRDEERIVDAVDGLVAALTGVLNEVRLFTRDDEHMNTLLELLTTTTSLQRAIQEIKEAQAALVKAKRDVLTFPEADKRELFHHAPQLEPVPIYRDPVAGMYASW